MGCRLYIGNLPWSARPQDLLAAFQAVGPVIEVVVMGDNEPDPDAPATPTRWRWRARGYGFVEMATERDAARARARLDGLVLGGREIYIEPVREPHPRARYRGYRSPNDRDR